MGHSSKSKVFKDERDQQIGTHSKSWALEFMIAAGINVEMYTDASKFEQGAQDQEYYCEVWIPVEKK